MRSLLCLRSFLANQSDWTAAGHRCPDGRPVGVSTLDRLVLFWAVSRSSLWHLLVLGVAAEDLTRGTPDVSLALPAYMARQDLWGRLEVNGDPCWRRLRWSGGFWSQHEMRLKRTGHPLLTGRLRLRIGRSSPGEALSDSSVACRYRWSRTTVRDHRFHLGKCRSQPCWLAHHFWPASGSVEIGS